MISLIEILKFFGRAICHQLPERTFIIDSHYMPVCARDTGIYIGIFCSLLYIFLKKKHKSNMIPTIPISFFLFSLFIPMGYDGLSEYLFHIESTNLSRIVTGIPFGITFPFFLIPLINYSNKQLNEVRVINKWYEILYPLLLACVLGYLTYNAYINYYVISLLVIISIIFWFSLIVFALVKVVSFFPNNYIKYIISLVLAIILLSCLSLIFSEIMEYFKANHYI